MRVLVACSSLGDLSPRQACTAVARGFAGRSQVAVAPVASAGSGLPGALAEPARGRIEASGTGWIVVAPTLLAAGLYGSLSGRSRGLPLAATSAALGQVAVHALAAHPGRPRLILDLTGVDAHDAGAGLLASLGARADVELGAGVGPLAEVTAVDLGPARRRLEGIDVEGVVPVAERDHQLLGLRGITARRGHQDQVDPAVMLATDAALARFATAVAPELVAADGAGACGGLGLAVLALGGRLTSAPQACASLTGLLDTIAHADLVITGTDRFDVGSRGGEVVGFVAELAQASMVPCVVVAGSVDISRREMRTFGVEAAFEVPLGSSAGLTAAAERLAATWSW